MKYPFRKKDILTVPNYLSFFRILLIPLFLVLYASEKTAAALSVLLLSGFTDILDGQIARRFDMVSEFGKLLDPLADKLTQGALLVCLLPKDGRLLIITLLFAATETVKGRMGYLAAKKTGKVSGARWYGKLNTVILFCTVLLFLFVPTLPAALSAAMTFFCTVSVLFSFFMYVDYYENCLAEIKKE